MLTDKQKRFCDEYLANSANATLAYKAAYDPYMSDSVAAACGIRLLRNAKVRQYISERQEQLKDKLHITQEMVLAEYAKIGFFDIRKVYDESGALKNIQDLDDQTAGAIAGVESYEEKVRAGEETIVTGLNKKLKIWDKRAALDSICKVLGYNSPEKKQISGEVELKNKIKVIIPGEEEQEPE